MTKKLTMLVGIYISTLASVASAQLATMSPPFSTPDYYAYPNWTFSPLPTINQTTGELTGGLRKFRDGFAGFCDVSGMNNLNQCLPIAKPDTTTYPGSDYYKLELSEYAKKMNSDLPATPLRGYAVDGSNDHQYLGPFIVATKDKPVRVKFTNKLTTDLPIPNDSTYMGAGIVDDGVNTKKASLKRAELHLHGGASPWISDGTPHQWVTPVGGDGQPSATGFQKGQSFVNVPDMVTNGTAPCAATKPTECITPSLSDGIQTLYWTNQQSGRTMFYHDHTYGNTRLNVYAGEAAGYLLVDPNEEQALASASAPGTIVNPANLLDPANDLTHMLPIVIQDKTFVPDNGEPGGLLALTDPTWPSPANPLPNGAGYGAGSLWFPHVYMPNQFPNDPSFAGANAYGRWDLAQWMNPPMITNIPDVACTSPVYPGVALRCPPTPNPSGAPEAFMDTPVVNGTAYPTLSIKPSAYRFNILNASNDRIMNLGIYYASTGGPIASIIDTAGSGAMLKAIANNTGGIAAIEVIDGGVGYNPATTKIAVATASKNLPTQPTFSITTDVDGMITSVSVLSPGSGYTKEGIVCKDGAVADATECTEVSLIPANAHRSKINTNAPTPSVCTNGNMVNVNVGSGLTTAIMTQVTSGTYTGMADPNVCWPNSWPDDGNAGQHVVPRPQDAGPPIIQISTESGMLPQAVVIPSTPLGFEYNRKSATVLNGRQHGLLVGPAERNGVIVDFSKFAPKAGKSVFILYNDGAAPLPGFDPRNDYFTGNPDQTATGGAPSTLPGYGPNIRTLMQFVVEGAPDNVEPFNVTKLINTVPSIFDSVQDTIIVPEKGYIGANGNSNGVDNYPQATDTGITLSIPGPLAGVTLTNPGSSYTTLPTVEIEPPVGCTLSVEPDDTCVQAKAVAMMAASVQNLTLTAGSNGSAAGLYLTAPTVSINGDGIGATATATMSTTGGVKSVNITNGGSYTRNNARVTFSAPPAGGIRATGTVTTTRIGNNYSIRRIAITNPGSGYVTPPTVTFTGSGIQATASSVIGYNVASLTLTNPGSGYMNAPTVTFTGGSGRGATATATLGVKTFQKISLTNPGNGYPKSPANPPNVVITGGSGTGATAVAVLPGIVQTPFSYKAVIEGFTFDTGRMNAQLGTGFPVLGQNLNAVAAVPFGYVDPTSDMFKNGETQLWRFSHMGIDVHYIHFHLFNVQIINRIGIDGSLRAPNENELGWKETVRMNPFEDVVLALRPIKPTLPWDLPNSIRMMDVTAKAGTVNGPINCQNNPLAPPGPVLPNCLPFTIADTTGNQVFITNSKINYGAEYVFHCHLLGHEENDMMRPMSLIVPPKAPVSPKITLSGVTGQQRATLTWVDNSLNETSFTIQRSISPAGPWSNVVQLSNTGPTKGTGQSYTTGNLTSKQTFYFRVLASNTVGCDNLTCSNPFDGWFPTTADSTAIDFGSVTTN